MLLLCFLMMPPTFLAHFDANPHANPHQYNDLQEKNWSGIHNCSLSSHHQDVIKTCLIWLCHQLSYRPQPIYSNIKHSSALLEPIFTNVPILKKPKIIPYHRSLASWVPQWRMQPLPQSLWSTLLIKKTKPYTGIHSYHWHSWRTEMATKP